MANPIARLELTYMDDGNVQVGGPLHDKVLCLGIIERAKNAIHNFNPQASGIVGASALPGLPPGIVPVPGMGGKRG